MPSKIPRTSAESTALFHSLVDQDPRFLVKKLFGNPAAFVNGNLCLGTFGPDVFLRLSEEDQARLISVPGVRHFEPMPGRPMKGYLVLPRTLLEDRQEGPKWVERAVRWTKSLPTNTSKAKR
jgi:TfoX/Sxy family transcriptional regulator of competence genes